MNEIKLEVHTDSETVFCPCCSVALHISDAFNELATLHDYHLLQDNETSSQTTFNTDPVKILLVDDHRSFMDGLQMVIDTQKPRMETIGTATTPDEALETAFRLKPDIILLDLDLGDASGLDILPDLVEKTDSKILIITGVRDPEMYDATIMKGARGVLFKGESAEVMIKAIERVHAGGVWIDSNILERVIGQNSESKPVLSEPEARRIAHLTRREREVITALLEFESSNSIEVANHLGISKHTLKNNLTTIYNKLGMKNRVQLMRFALNNKTQLTEAAS